MAATSEKENTAPQMSCCVPHCRGIARRCWNSYLSLVWSGGPTRDSPRSPPAPVCTFSSWWVAMRLRGCGTEAAGWKDGLSRDGTTRIGPRGLEDDRCLGSRGESCRGRGQSCSFRTSSAAGVQGVSREQPRSGEKQLESSRTPFRLGSRHLASVEENRSPTPNREEYRGAAAKPPDRNHCPRIPPADLYRAPGSPECHRAPELRRTAAGPHFPLTHPWCWGPSDTSSQNKGSWSSGSKCCPLDLKPTNALEKSSFSFFGVKPIFRQQMCPERGLGSQNDYKTRMCDHAEKKNSWRGKWRGKW